MWARNDGTTKTSDGLKDVGAMIMDNHSSTLFAQTVMFTVIIKKLFRRANAMICLRERKSSVEEEMNHIRKKMRRNTQVGIGRISLEKRTGMRFEE